jgi:hypothetical protein
LPEPGPLVAVPCPGEPRGLICFDADQFELFYIRTVIGLEPRDHDQ